jgi:caffeoyl-CoA O-methyltransferase
VTPIADLAVERYATTHTTQLPPEFAAIAEQTERTLGLAEMLSGPIVGRLLEILVHAVRAKQVLEIGTFSGLSAIAMAAGLAPGGRIVSCEVNPTHARFARERIEQAGLADTIDVRLGPALETIAGLEGPFDLIFIDADKPGYLGYYEATLPLLAPNGLIVADNTLRGGEIMDPPHDDPGTVAMAEFNDHVCNDERVVAVVLTVRDGVTVIRRAG